MSNIFTAGVQVQNENETARLSFASINDRNEDAINGTINGTKPNPSVDIEEANNSLT